MDTTTPFETLLYAAGSGRRTPPVERWNPPLCGEIDIRIAADGTWYHEGGPINRTRLARLFSSLLRKDEDGVTYLVTPHEKLAITVDDAPLIGVDHAVRETDDGCTLALRTNMDDLVEIGPDHAVRFELEPNTDGIKPYAHIRGRIEALINRSTTMAILNDDRLVDFSGDEPFLRSAGCEFPIKLA